MSVKNGFTIPSDQAAEWTAKWRSKHPELKGFLIPVEDLFGVLEEMKILSATGVEGEYRYNPGSKNFVRSYLGVDSNNKPHMMFVGTKKFPDSRFPDGYVHRDLYDGGVDGQKGSLAKQEEFSGSGIYDFTEPCPDSCDDKSILFG